MKYLMKHGWMSVVASIALFALAGCSQASAKSPTLDEPVAPAEVVAANRQPTAQADADNGPGCAEPALHVVAQATQKK